MPSSKRKTLADLGPRDYAFYFFEKNPFQAVPVAMQDPDFLTDRDTVFNELRDAIAISMHNGTLQGRMLVADYGMGKSHILKFIRRRINIDLREGQRGRAIAAYTIPGKSMLDLYIGILKDLGEEFLVEVSSLISKDIQPEPMHGAQYALWSDVGGQSFYVRGYVKAAWEKLPEKVQAWLDKDTFAALSVLNERKFRDDAFYWLQGGNLPRSRTGEMGISSRITKDTAQDAFVTLVKVLHLAGYDHFYLCLDEMEKLTYLTRQLRSEYFEQLRYVIDQLTTGFSIFGAITPEAEKLLEEERHAFQSRIGQFPRQGLRALSTSHVIELVRDYMHEERRLYGSEDQKLIEVLYSRFQEVGIPIDIEDHLSLSLFPFSQDVIKAIGDQSRGNPRNILRFCSTLIEKGCEQKKIFYDVAEALSLLDLHDEDEVK